MTAVAEPLSTLVPRKQRLVCSMDGNVWPRVARVAFFHRQRFAGERGLDDEQILRGNQRTSPGIMSPAESFTMSPGTSSLSGISFGWPSRSDGRGDLDHRLEFGRGVVGLCFLNETQRHAQHHHHHHHRAADVVARARSAVANVMMARTVSRMTSGLRDGDPKPLQPAVLFFLRDLVGAVLLPAARPLPSSLKPVGEVCNCCKTADISCVAASRTESAAFWFAEFFGLGINQLIAKISGVRNTTGRNSFASFGSLLFRKMNFSPA